MIINKKLFNITIVIALISSVGAIIIPEIYKVPYAFYNIIRVTMFSSLLYITFYIYKHNELILSYFFMMMVILYNPIMQIYLKRNIWILIDIIIVLLIIYTILKFKKSTKVNTLLQDTTCNISNEVNKLKKYLDVIDKNYSDLIKVQEQIHLIGVSLGQFQENLFKSLFRQHNLVYENLRIVEAIKMLTNYYDKNTINDFFHINQVRNNIIHSSDRGGDLKKDNQDYIIADIKAAIAKVEYLNSKLNK